MADGNGSAVDVEFGAIEAKLAHASKDLCSKGFVDLESINLRQLEASEFQKLLNGWHRSDAHDLGRNADDCSGHDSRQRFFIALFQVGARGDQRRSGTIDDRGAVPASLNAAECGSKFGENFERRGANVSIFAQLLNAARQADSTRGVALQIKCFADYGRNLPAQEASFLRSDGAGKTFGGELIDVFPSNSILLGEFLGGGTHGQVAGWIEERLPQKVLELDFSHAETAAVGVGGDGIAGHRFRADDQGQSGFGELDGIGSLQNRLNAGAAHALHKVSRDFDWNSGIKRDVAREHIGIK